MLLNFGVPAAILDDKRQRFGFKPLHVVRNEGVQDGGELVSDFLQGLVLQLFDFIAHFIDSVVSDQFKLSVKKLVHLLKERCFELSEYFLKDFLIVLLCFVSEILVSLPVDVGAGLPEFIKYLPLALVCEHLELGCDQLHGFILDLIATVVCDDLTLSGQIKLFLLPDDVPGLIDKDRQAINGYIRVATISL